VFKRIVTGLILFAAALLLITVQGWYLRVTILVISVVSLHEMFTALKAAGMDGVRWPAFAFAALAFLQQAFRDRLFFLGDSPLLVAFILCVTAGIVSIVVIGKPDFNGMIATLFPMLYPGLFYAFLMKLQDLDGRAVPTMALAMAIVVPSANDVFALFIGKAFGKRKLIPGISPNKTVAGSVAGILASVAFSVAVPFLIVQADIRISGASGAVTLAPWWVFAVFGLVIGALSQIGDLTASLVKRHCGIKDYGRIFPGHGGMMDRLDAILFGSLACYVFFMLTGN
jgi:phosphatidate cytidylyltransferase